MKSDRRAARAKVPAEAVAPPAAYRLEIPATPPSLNRLMRGRIRDRIRLGKSWRFAVHLAFHLSGIPRATGRRRVTLSVTWGPGERSIDPDNLNKCLGDSLKTAGAIRGDSYRWVTWGEAVYRRGPTARTVVVLEDVPAAEIRREPAEEDV
jgi:hypothetical protein